MIQVSATMRILVAIEPVDLRKGIDGLAQFCREKLTSDPFSGCLFIFRSRLRPWKGLALFLREAGAPVDNNVVERSLKRIGTSI